MQRHLQGFNRISGNLKDVKSYFKSLKGTGTVYHGGGGGRTFDQCFGAGSFCPDRVFFLNPDPDRPKIGTDPIRKNPDLSS